MNGFVKLFESILASSVWAEDDKTVRVWITMLVMKNRDQIVNASLPGLAHMARVSLEDCERALKKFESPDQYSRSKEHEGRRIQAVEGGWLVLNGQKYTELLSYEHRKEYKRQKQREYRARQNGGYMKIKPNKTLEERLAEKE